MVFRGFPLLLDGSKVVTSSDVWLSMVAGTSLAISVYCVGATACIVYALYNAPTFYKEPILSLYKSYMPIEDKIYIICLLYIDVYMYMM